MTQLVTTVQTTPTMTEFAHALLLAWPEATKEAAAIIWAQFGLETGNGHYCFNYNIGNVKHHDGDGFDWMALRGVYEYVNGQRVEIPITSPGAWFRAYPSLDAGLAYHLEFLRTHYPTAWIAASAGDVNAFAHELAKGHYFTATEQSYAIGMRGPFTAFLKGGVFESAKAYLEQDTDDPVSSSDFDTIHPAVDWDPIVYIWDDIA